MHKLVLVNTGIPVACTKGQNWMEKHIEALPVNVSDYHQRRLAATLLCSGD